MKRVMLLFVALLVGCTTMNDLKPSSDRLYILVPEDYVRIQKRGIGLTKFAEGLKAGEYTSFAEDQDGIYFGGKGAPVIMLAGENAESYEREKQIPPSVLGRRDVFPRALNVGGIWLPKSGVKKEPKLFYEIRNATDGSVAGLVGVSIVAMTEGSLGYIPFGSEREFIDSLMVMRK